MLVFASHAVGDSVAQVQTAKREWTSTARGSGVFEVRGGSTNHVEAGRACQWDFTVAQRATAAPNTGFRCCMY